ncbi:hypothetical protein MRB53_039521 [Persea americana]|nr:hypothetical protein MRB53_039521 [Persea americana]
MNCIKAPVDTNHRGRLRRTWLRIHDRLCRRRNHSDSLEHAELRDPRCLKSLSLLNMRISKYESKVLRSLRLSPLYSSDTSVLLQRDVSSCCVSFCTHALLGLWQAQPCSLRALDAQRGSCGAVWRRVSAVAPGRKLPTAHGRVSARRCDCLVAYKAATTPSSSRHEETWRGTPSAGACRGDWTRGKQVRLLSEDIAPKQISGSCSSELATSSRSKSFPGGRPGPRGLRIGLLTSISLFPQQGRR